MEIKQEDSFLVDVGKTMVDTNRISSEGKDSQRLYCKCGDTKELKHKARRLLVKKHDTTVEDKHSILSFSCDKCKTTYDKDNRIFLLVPDEDEIYKIRFRSEETSKHITLNREKIFARFDSVTNKLHHTILRTDYIKFDKAAKTAKIFLNKPALDKTMAQQKQTDSSDTSEEIGLSRINRLEHFFQFHDFAIYMNLDEIYKFFNSLAPFVADVEVIKQLNSKIKFCFKNYEIFEKQVNNELVSYLNQDGGYGDGKKEIVRLNVGGYLSRYVDVSKIFLCVADFPSITTVLLTKGEKFFTEFLHSKNVLNAKVFKKFEATSPIKIIEVSLNYDNNGNLRDTESKTIAKTAAKTSIEDNESYLKVSPLIYKNITTPSDMDILLSVHRKKLISKSDMEVLFSEYDSVRVYKFFRNLEKQRHIDHNKFTLRHVKHIFDYSIDDVQKGQNADYLHLYLDTMNTADLLELPVNYIFKHVKTNFELKTIHDDLAARYGAIKDQKKAQFYQKAVQELGAINTVIDDISFQIVPTLEDLNKEGMTMGHCVYTYLDKVVGKNYVAVHVQHLLSNERATLGLTRNGNSLGFDQLKGYQNSRASREMIEATNEFLEKNKIRSSGGSSGDLAPNSGYTKRMHDYLSDEQVTELRRKRAEKEKAEKEKAEKEGKDYVPSTPEKTTKTKGKNKGILGGLFGN